MNVREKRTVFTAGNHNLVISNNNNPRLSSIDCQLQIIELGRSREYRDYLENNRLHQMLNKEKKVASVYHGTSSGKRASVTDFSEIRKLYKTR